jgi:hypothetical protein
VTKRAMAAAKVVGMILLVVMPGGSVVLLAMAGYRAYQKRSGPFSPNARMELRKAFVSPLAWVGRNVRMPFHPAQSRA